MKRIIAWMLAAVMVMLAAGACAQGVLGNRLASPATIGVNAGAALGVTLCAAAGLAGGMFPVLAAFGGAFLAAGLIGLAAGRWGSAEGTIILLGAAMNSILGALSDCVVTLWPEVSVMSADASDSAYSR